MGDRIGTLLPEYITGLLTCRHK